MCRYILSTSLWHAAEVSKGKTSSQNLDDKRINFRKVYGPQVNSGISQMLLRSQLEQTFREKSAHICDEEPDAKIYAYHVLHSNYMEVIFGIQALYSNSCFPPDVAHMLHVRTSSYIYLTLSLSLPVPLSHFNSLNFNCKCGVPQRNPPLISVQMNRMYSPVHNNA